MSRLASVWGRIRARFRREPVKWWRELAEQEKRLSERMDALVGDWSNAIANLAERLDSHGYRLDGLATERNLSKSAIYELRKAAMVTSSSIASLKARVGALERAAARRKPKPRAKAKRP